jgi:transcriptional regulator with GAF, ATPase, and Fis domain
MTKWVKISLCTCGGISVCYCIATLVFVVTAPDLRLRTLLVNRGEGAKGRFGPAVRLYAGPDAEDKIGAQAPPAPGDLLYEINGERIRTFSDFSQALVELRSATRQPGGELPKGADPDELNSASSHTLLEIRARKRVDSSDEPEGERFMRVRFFRAGEEIRSTSWIKLQPLPAFGLILVLIWLVPQLMIFSLSAVAYWNRPHDRSARLFFVLSFVTLVAFVGGSHWWVVAGSPWFCLPFVAAAVLLPPVLLHLFVVYPTPRPVMLEWPRATLAAIYVLPALFLMGLLGTIGLLFVLVGDVGVPGPFALLWESQTGLLAEWLLRLLRDGIVVYVGLAVVYFVLTICSLAHSAFTTRPVFERREVQWLFRAGLAAGGFVGYAAYLAFFRRVDLALGAGQVPIFLASFSFLWAFAVGMVRYKLMLIDEVISRGMLYYVLSAFLTVLFSLVIAGGSVLALRQQMSLINQAVALTLVLMLMIVGLDWLRARVQRVIDQEFFREKYQLDKAMQRMNRAVAGLVDRESLAVQMLSSCCDVLGVTSAACYLRDGDEETFRRFARLGDRDFAQQVEVGRAHWPVLQQGVSFQRLRAGGSPTQMLMRSLGGDLIHGLDVDGEMVGLIVLGPKPNSAAFTPEDGTFLSAVERIAGFALHFAKVHEDFDQIKNELERRIGQVGEQQRRITLLERQLSLHTPASPATEEHSFQAAEIIGHSPSIRRVLETIRKVAASESSVLVRGESGTGKELLARAIHQNSPRRDGPLVSLHCAALSPTLMESELFGHVRGAFTDAREDKIGRFQLANGGTLFFDEVGDISLDVQVKLLRVLQQRTFEPVGSHQTVHVDVRVIAATHRHLERLIAEGRFREDLYYRLNVISVTVPPLRERKDDIVELALHFLEDANRRTNKSVTQIEESALEALMNHSWPGNIRELENVIERAVVLAEGPRITCQELPVEVMGGARRPQQVIETKLPESASPAPGANGWPVPLLPREVRQQAERQRLERALERAHGNKAEAARLLGLPRSTFCSKLKKHSLS